MTALLQVSDAHFGTEQGPVVEALHELAVRVSPEVFILSGDVTQRARRGQFERARRFTARLPPARVLAVPGNHDIPLFDVFSRVFRPYANYARAFGGDLEPEFSSELALVICVNTTHPRRRKDGEVSAAQVDRVGERLRQAHPAQVRILVLHHPVIAATRSDVQNLLHGREAALPAWAEAGADLVLGGHIHLPYVRSLREEWPQLPRPVWAIQAGTAVSRRTRDGVPNSVNLLRCSSTAGARRCVVERWDYRSSAGRFEQVATTALMFSP